MQSADSDVPLRARSIFYLIIASEFSALSLPPILPLCYIVPSPHSLHCIFTLTHFLSFPMNSHSFIKATAEKQVERYSNGLTWDFLSRL